MKEWLIRVLGPVVARHAATALLGALIGVLVDTGLLGGEAGQALLHVLSGL